MPILNYTTDIAAAKTQGEITQALARKGIARIATAYDEDGNAIGLAFTMRTEYGMRDFEVPVATEGVLAAMSKDPKVSKAKQTRTQAERVAWRILKDWVEAQVALIEAGMASMDQVMFPYMVTDSGRSTYQVYAAQQKAISA